MHEDKDAGKAERPIGPRDAPQAHEAKDLAAKCGLTQDELNRLRKGEAIVVALEDAIVTNTLDGTIVFWNRGAERLFGYTAAEAVGQSIYLIVPPESREEEAEILDRLGRGERIEHYETVRLTKDGRRLDISLIISPIRNEAGQIIGVSKVPRDISARKRTEEAVRDTTARERAYLEHLPVGVWFVDTEGQIFYGNNAGRRIWGGAKYVGSGAYFEYKGWWHNTGARISAEEWAAARAVHKGETSLNEVIDIECFDGTRKTILNSAVPVRAENGTIIGAVIFNQDITEQKATEQALRALTNSLDRQVGARTVELRAQNRRLQQLAKQLTTAEQRERGRLAAMLHDGLQQILIAIKMQMGMLRRKNPNGTDRLKDLLDEAIDTARSLAYELSPPALQKNGLPEALAWLADWHRTNSDFDVQLHVTDGFPPVDEDAKAFLFHALRELVLNALKHSGEASASVELEQTQDGHVRVSVSDSGRGFNPRDIDAMDAGVHGVSLYSLREQTAGFGGNLAITANPGAGAKFDLTLPLEKVTAARADGKLVKSGRASASHSVPEGEGSGRVRILVVDDHTLVREGIVSLLNQHESIQVVGEARDGVDALDRTEELRPDVVLMDIHMPRMNGIDATRQIKRRHPAITVIGLSLHNEGHLAQAMRDAGATAYIDKAGDSDTLVETICTFGMPIQ